MSQRYNTEKIIMSQRYNTDKRIMYQRYNKEKIIMSQKSWKQKKKIVSKQYFYIDKLQNGVVVKSLASGGGILLVKIVNGKKYLLLQTYLENKWPLLDDFGGCAEMYDTNIFKTIDREVAEETNDVIKVDSQNLKCIPVYVPTCKYLCLIVQVNADEYQEIDVFGTSEWTTKYQRTVAWHELTDELKPKLNWRIRHRMIYNALTQLS